LAGNQAFPLFSRIITEVLRNGVGWRKGSKEEAELPGVWIGRCHITFVETAATHVLLVKFTSTEQLASWQASLLILQWEPYGLALLVLQAVTIFIWIAVIVLVSFQIRQYWD